MARGKGHDRFNLLVGAVLVGLLLGLSNPLILVSCFAMGWLVATLVFSPDSDVMPKKRTGVLAFFLYPYAIFFKHRGISHSLFFGTLTRVFYVLMVFGLMIFVLNRMGYLVFGAMGYWQGIWAFIKGYDYSLVSYKMITWLYLGMFLADLAHILLDRLISSFKRIISF